MLDYFIDQEEDRTGSDLNFRSYYKNEQEMIERFVDFIQQAYKAVSQLPHKQFHRMINHALLGVYLANEKVNKQNNIKENHKQILRSSDISSYFFFGTP